MNTDLKYYYLKNNEVCGSLSKEQLMSLTQIAKLKSFERGAPIFLGGDGNSKIHFLIKGKIKIVAFDELGRELIKDILNEGEFFGAIGLDAFPPTEDFASALTENTTICSFSINEFQKVLQLNSTLAFTYAKSLGSKLRKLESRHANLVFKDVKSRLIQFFKDWAEREGNVNGDKIVIKNYLTHSDIACFIATSRQSVTQLLNEFKSEGYLFYNRKLIEINRKAILN